MAILERQTNYSEENKLCFHDFPTNDFEGMPLTAVTMSNCIKTRATGGCRHCMQIYSWLIRDGFCTQWSNWNSETKAINWKLSWKLLVKIRNESGSWKCLLANFEDWAAPWTRPQRATLEKAPWTRLYLSTLYFSLKTKQRRGQGYTSARCIRRFPTSK